MKWRESTICADLNDSKLNVRDENDKLFEIIPKLSLESDEPGVECYGDTPGKFRVIGVSTGGSGYRFGVAMNSDFLVLNASLDQVERHIEFNATIDFVVWRRSILLIGLASSEIILLNPNTFEQNESRKVCPMEGKECERFFVDAFLHSNPDPSKLDLLAMGVDGIVYTFADVSLSAGSLDFTHDENCSIDIDIASIKGTAKRCLPLGTHIVTANSPGSCHMITGDQSGRISIFDIRDEGDSIGEKLFRSIDLTNIYDIPGESVHLKKIVRFEGLLFVLLNGSLEIMFDEELFPIATFRLPSSAHIVHDFEIVMMSAEVFKLWVLFSNMEESDHFVGIANGPAFNMEFVIRIPSISDTSGESTFKFPVSGSPFDEPNVFIEIAADGTTKVYQMMEFSTDISLQNLLLKGKFGKAELLAKRYDKNLDLVWKAKVVAKYNELLISILEIESVKLFQEIKKILGVIHDPEFVCGFSIESGFPRFDWVKELLEIGMNRVGECTGSENGKKLLITAKKLYTFQQVLPNSEIQRWNEFNSVSTSMFLQCLKFLQNVEFQQSEIVWLRHCDEFLPEVELHDFARFFKKLFWKRLDSTAGISLFKTIFPYAIEKCESATREENEAKADGLLGLVNYQIRALEREDRWPEEAITFTKTLITAVREEYEKLEEQKDEVEEPKIFLHLEICKEILKRLELVIQSLAELEQLRQSHSIRIAFDDYINGSKFDVINSMLAVLFMKDEVELFVKDFLAPFAARNGLSVDEILQQHIEMMLSDVAYFMGSDSIPFEERVLTLVEFIDSHRVRLSCVLRVAKEWPVPWFSPMEEVVKRAVKLNVQGDLICTENQKLIQVIHTQVPYRCLMQKYRLSASKLSFGFNVIHTIKRILKSQKPDAYEDCLELIKHTSKCDVDGLRSIKFWYDLIDTTKPIDEVLKENLNQELMRRFLGRILQQFREGTTLHDKSKENWERFTECGRSLAYRIGDDKTIQFFQLRNIMDDLWEDDIVLSGNYPFSVLQVILEQNQDEPSSIIIERCNRLSKISFTPFKDILLAAGSFFCEAQTRGSVMTKIWDIVKEMVTIPGLFHTKGEIVPYAGLTVAHYLLLFATTTPTDQLEILQEFYRLVLNSYADEIIEPLVKLMQILKIFLELRDKEIPLENEFLSIYKEVWRECRKGTTVLLSELVSLGESILKFGDTELLGQIFSAVHQEYSHQSNNYFNPLKNELFEAAELVLRHKDTLIANKADYDVDEKNLRIVGLVKSLNSAGLSLNAFSLRQRNKARLIQKLVDLNLFLLASQTALVFDFRDGLSWSKILTEYVRLGTIPELKTLLESLKKMSELWVLPEFKSAWLKVSEEYPTFRYMCPIPL